MAEAYFGREPFDDDPRQVGRLDLELGHQDLKSDPRGRLNGLHPFFHTPPVAGNLASGRCASKRGKTTGPDHFSLAYTNGCIAVLRDDGVEQVYLLDASKPWYDPILNARG